MMMLQEGGNYNNSESEWVLENLMAAVHNEAAPRPPILLSPLHHLNYNYTPMQTTTTTTTTLINTSFLHHHFLSPAHHLQKQQLETSPPPTTTDKCSYNKVMKKKKENHNASERERRKKLNNLYSSLRSLLPPTHHHHMKKKKQSIPTTVSQVLEYVPDLKHQLEGLIQHKQHLLSRSVSTTAHHHDIITHTRLLVDDDQGNKTSCADISEAAAAAAAAAVCVTVNMMNTTAEGAGDEEVVVQISQPIIIKDNMVVPLSELIRVLEKQGFILINLSSTLHLPASSTHLFYTLHLQAGTNTLQPVERIEAFLRDNILSLRLHLPY